MQSACGQLRPSQGLRGFHLSIVSRSPPLLHRQCDSFPSKGSVRAFQRMCPNAQRILRLHLTNASSSSKSIHFLRQRLEISHKKFTDHWKDPFGRLASQWAHLWRDHASSYIFLSSSQRYREVIRHSLRVWCTFCRWSKDWLCPRVHVPRRLPHKLLPYAYESSLIYPGVFGAPLSVGVLGRFPLEGWNPHRPRFCLVSTLLSGDP